MARIVGVDLPSNKRGEIALTYIYGIGRSSARAILSGAGIDYDLKVKDWNDDQLGAVRKIIGTEYKVEGELRSSVQMNIKRLMDIGCYRGVRHRLGLPVRGQLSGLGDNPAMEDLIGVANDMFDVYKDGEVDAVYIAYNKFVNTMAQKPVYQQLIPLPALETDNLEQRQSTWDYLYEPEPKVLLDSLLTRYLESQVYQSVVDNLASEQAARMVAMKAATDNAGNLINDLRLVYNKARQASITNELNEIVAGAAAI